MRWRVFHVANPALCVPRASNVAPIREEVGDDGARRKGMR
jgi:hypothetical protein